MADERLRTKSELKRLFTNLQGKSISDGMFSILIDVLWRDKVTQRGSGFEFPGSVDVLISFEEGTRTFTIKPFDLLLPDHDPRYGIYSFTHFATFHRMYGERTIQLPNEEGLYLIYFDAESYPGNAQILTFLKNPTKDQIQNIIQYKVSIASIYWDATANEALYFGNDKHGSEWNGPIHWYLHSTIGASRSSGLQFSNLEIGQNGSANSHAQFTVTGGVMLHDDFELNIPDSTTSIPILYSFGDLPRFLSNPGYGIAKGTSRIYFNSGQSSLVECSSGNYCLYHLFSTNEILTTSRKTISVMGIDEYTTLADAHANVNIELDSVRTYMPQQGTCYIGTIIVQTDDTYTNSIKARIASITGNETHPPVSIHPDSSEILSINDKQQLSINTDGLGGGGGLSEIPFEHCVEAGVAETMDIDLYVTGSYDISGAIIESDGTLNNVTIKIDGVAITGLDDMTVSSLSIFTSTALNTAAIGTRITISVTASYSGTPTFINGKILLA